MLTLDIFVDATLIGVFSLNRVIFDEYVKSIHNFVYKCLRTTDMFRVIVIDMSET
jgi:hypothetical protein